jgi:hypothetical protein
MTSKHIAAIARALVKNMHGDPSTWPDGDENANMRALSERLGLSLHPNWLAQWALIGMTLAYDQREFGGGKRKRGRPKTIGPSIDYRRYKRLVERHGSDLGRGIPYASAIESAQDGGVPDFSGDMAALSVSVSKGKAEADRERRLIGERLAELLRRSANMLKQRKQWIDGIGVDVERLAKLNQEAGYIDPVPGFFGSSPSDMERLDLRSRLVNPFRDRSD